MLYWMRKRVIQKSIASLLLVTMTSTPVAALAAGVSQADVTAGQNLGLQFLGGAQAQPSVSTGTSTLEQTSNNTQLFLGDFLPGVNGAADNSALESMSDDPEALVGAGMALRTVQNETGCRVTHFNRKVAAGTVLKIRAIWRNSANVEIPASYTGPIRVNFPTLGTASRVEQVVQKGDGTNPSLILVYESTPYAYPSNSYFTYAPTITGNVSGNFTSIGAPENNFTFQGSFSAANTSVIEVKADLFKVDREFQIKPVCSPDPVTACLHESIDLCHPATTSLKSYFAKKGEKGETDIGVTALAMAKSASNAEDPDAEVIADGSADILDGTSTQVLELFSGCTRTEVSDKTSLTQHEEDLRTCRAVYQPPQGSCDRKRNIQLQPSGRWFREDIYNLAAIDPLQGNKRWTPNYSENVRATVSLRGPYGGGTNQTWVLNTNDRYVLRDQAATFNGVDSASWVTGLVSTDIPRGSNFQLQTGKRIWATHVENSLRSPDDVRIIDHGGAPNWEPTLNVRLGSNYRVTHVEYIVAADGVSSTGGDACAFVAQSISDNRCSRTCTIDRTKTTLNVFSPANGRTYPIPLAGAGESFWTVLGEKPQISTGCLSESTTTASCQLNDVPTDYFANLWAPEWVDNCHLEGKEFSPGGLVTATAECIRMESRDVCTDVGATSGKCYEKEVYYDCGLTKESSEITGVHVTEACGSPIRCLGTECGNTLGEANNDLADAMVAGNMMDAIQQEMICEETGEPPKGPYDDCTIRIFTGDKRSCNTAAAENVGFATDCCNEGANAAAGMGIGVTEGALAFDAAKKMATNDAFLGMLKKAPGAKYVDIAWTATKEAIKTVTKSIADGLTSYAQKLGWKMGTNAASSTVTSTVSQQAGTTLGAQMGSWVATNIANFLNNIGLDSVTGMLFQEAGKNAAGEVTKYALNEELKKSMLQVMDFVNGAMLAYTVLKLAGALLYGCEQGDYETGMERAKGNCHRVGTYCSKEFPSELGGGCEIDTTTFCCYQSPLNRIIAEQMREQKGGYGSAQYPNCSGFTLEEINAFDWATLDLSEWEEIQRQAGILPNTEEQAEAQWGENADPATQMSNGPSPGPDGRVTSVDYFDYRMANRDDDIEASRKALSDNVGCSYNGGIQWYGSPDEFTDKANVDIFVVKKVFSVDYRASWWCGGGSDGDAIYGWAPEITVDPLTNALISGGVNVYCDGRFQAKTGTIQGTSLKSTRYFFDGTEITELPPDVAGKECRATPENAGWESFVTTYANGNQTYSPTCQATASQYTSRVLSKGWKTMDSVMDVEVTYQLRRQTTNSAVGVAVEATNCVNPNAP